MQIISKTNSIFLIGLRLGYSHDACYMSFLCITCDSHSSNYKEFHILRYNVVWSVESQPTFQMSQPGKNLAKLYFLPVLL
jgi:hypothetical protein